MNYRQSQRLPKIYTIQSSLETIITTLASVLPSILNVFVSYGSGATICHFFKLAIEQAISVLPFISVSKLVQNHSKKMCFPYRFLDERFCTRTCFEKQAQVNSHMVRFRRKKKPRFSVYVPVRVFIHHIPRVKMYYLMYRMYKNSHIRM